MRSPPRILAVDDVPENLDIVRMRLEAHGYEVVTAMDGEEALTQAREHLPDLILLDIMMPKLDGISVLKILKQDQRFGFVPIILLTAKADRTDIVAGLDAGGDDYLTKPFDQAALIARVRSMLRIKALHDVVQDQTVQLAAQTKQLENWNQSLAQKVTEQVTEIERMSRLKRFLSPQVADVIAASSEQEDLLRSHRREVTVLFCDLRGFTAFTEIAEPEEVMAVLHEFHHALGQLIDRYEGTLERFAGDGLLTLFNDPLSCPDHTMRAVRMAVEMRESVEVLARTWRKRGHDLGFGIGIALGYATLGKIGFERRFDYAAVGTVTNLASRLCDEAKPGQILVDQRVFNVIEETFDARSIGTLNLKGFRRAVEAFEIIGARS
ncbi:response regulator [Methyloferula stellata]|uniref:response regulator n=1 Tax=Methyloferula stellata TaxID=876270 RepID=UPI00037728F1|nr:response regulator [Methyloferula stellata]